MIGSIIYNLFITPLEYIFEVVFYIINKITGVPAIAIIGLSLVMNFLVLPLYKRADAIQEEERDKVASMSKWVSHIKKTFKGDERYMMLNTYYRQHDYKPIYALRSSFSLILQIPFFIAAYHYLSNLAILNGASFLFLKDLGSPDQLLHIGSITINIMPIIMTLINFASGYIYLRGFPLKDKIQTYGIGVIFLILLYNSPSGLVFYWTLNQLFSMLKNVFMKLVKSRKVLNIIFSLAGVLIVVLALLFIHDYSKKRVAVIVLLFIVCQMPSLLTLIRKRFPAKTTEARPVKYRDFLLAGIFLSILMGVIVPVSVISSSPTEFLTGATTPRMLVILTLATSLGYFVVWFGIFFYLANPKMKRVFYYLIWLLSGLCVIDFLFFGKSFGTMSIYLIFDQTPEYVFKEKILNLVIIIALAAVLILFMYFFERFVPFVFIALIIGALSLSVINGIKVNNAIKTAEASTEADSHEREKIIPISKNGKNVIVFMLDRAISGYLPYAFKEKPELETAFSGFTYYPNTISFGGFTNFGTPPLFGGYEYRPLQMNERADESLADKHNEALKVMPKLFSDNGYTVTVCDPPYAGYQWVSDLSIFDDIDNVKAYHTMGQYNRAEDVESIVKDTKKIMTRNFFFYSVFKAVPVVLQNTVYDGGNYLSTTEVFQGIETFINCYSVLESLPELTDIRDTDEDTFLMMDNDITHEEVLLSWPDYIPTQDENAPHHADPSVYVIDGERLPLETDYQVKHYDVNMAAYIQMGKWMDYLKENNVYDNTRIIIVADHARNVEQFPKLMLKEADVERYNPLLLVKDFNSSEFTTSYDFMTNADVPYLAVNGLIDQPVNPYTGNELNNDAKYNEQMLVTTSGHWDLADFNGNTFDTSDGLWLEVHDNIFEPVNWKVVE